MKKSRKDKLYFTLIIFLFTLFFTIPFLRFSFDKFIVFELFLLLLIFLNFRKISKVPNESSISSEEAVVISAFEKLYPQVIILTSNTCKLIYNEIPSDFVKKYNIRIEETNSYLVKFNDNIQTFSNYSSSVFENSYVSLACLMDALASSWKIRSSTLDKNFSYYKIAEINCKLAIYATLSLLDIPYEKIKRSNAVKRLTDILILSNLHGNLGKLDNLVNEVFILELLIKNF